MRKFYGIFLILTFIFFFISYSLGEDLSLIAKVNKNRLKLGEEFEFIIEIKGSFKTTPDIEPPDLKDFEILSKRSSYNLQIKKGKFLSQTLLTFILRPKSEGKLIIGRALIRYRGKEYKTEPIEITVLPGFKKLPEEPEKKYPQEIFKITL